MSRAVIVVSVVLVLAAVGVAVRFASRLPSLGGSAVAFSADPPEVAFGEITQGQMVSRAIRLVNQLASDIQITMVVFDTGLPIESEVSVPVLGVTGDLTADDEEKP